MLPESSTILPGVSQSLLRFCVRLLPRYVNPSTFSMVFPSTSVFGWLLPPPNIIIAVLPILMISFASSFSILSECYTSSLFSSSRSTSSANCGSVAPYPRLNKAGQVNYLPYDTDKHTDTQTHMQNKEVERRM